RLSTRLSNTMTLRQPLRGLCAPLVLSAIALSSSSASAGTLYVDASLGSGANNGSSWADPFRGADGVQNALTAAVSGDQVWVAQGTYLPSITGNRAIAFALKTGVAIYGGFAGGETNLSQRDPVAHVTILSGDLNGDDASNLLNDNSYHVVDGN